MSGTRKFAISLGALGFIIALFLYALLSTGQPPEVQTVLLALEILCPPCVLSILAFTPDSSVAARIWVGFVWLLIALINFAIYYAVGLGLSALSRKFRPE